MTKGGIYKITNTANGKSYIGQTNNFQRRKSEHFSEMDEGIHCNKGLQNDYNLGYKFTFTELEVEYDKSRRDQLEKEYIAKYDTYYNGYNRTIDGQYPYKQTRTYNKPKVDNQPKTNKTEESDSDGDAICYIPIIIIAGILCFTALITNGIQSALIMLLLILFCCFGCGSSE